jgi:hypothetical protein
MITAAAIPNDTVPANRSKRRIANDLPRNPAFQTPKLAALQTTRIDVERRFRSSVG